MKAQVYFSSQHLWAARRMAAVAKEMESSQEVSERVELEHRSAVISSVFSSVAFLEAAINEIFQDAYDEHLKYISGIDPAGRTALAEFWVIIAEQNIRARSRLGTLEKYRTALTLTHADPIDLDSEAYDRARLLIRLQNALVHYKPSRLMEIDRSGFEEDLQGRFDPNPFRKGTEASFFPEKALGSGCARWSVESARTFADEAFGLLAIKPNYSTVALESGLDA